MLSLSWNPWMADVLPQMQPDYGQIGATQAEEMVESFMDQVPMPPEAPIIPRFGRVKTTPTIEDALGMDINVNLRPGDMGQQGYGGPGLGKW